jgi:alkylation response protein AidB-like acyl-CoA dehydrogenase
MHLQATPEEESFRAEVRAFLGAKLTPELRARAAAEAGIFVGPALAMQWHRILYEQGWVAPSWPVKFGGTAWSPMQRHIFEEECALAGAPSIPLMGLRLCAPVIIAFGTPEQQDFFLPRIASGEHYWCQGYSEPQSGSDLASLQTRAERDGDDYVVNGSKIWTTHAHVANWIFLLVRTSREGKPQQGISFLVSPLDAPGITVRPIRSMSGEHEVNQVFFDNVRIPVANRIGRENDGWTIAKHLLEEERGGGAEAPRTRARLRGIRNIIRAQAAEGDTTLAEDDGFQQQLAWLELDEMALDWTERRIAGRSGTGDLLSQTAASLKKLVGTELCQRAEALATDALGHFVLADQRGALDGSNRNAPPHPAWALTPGARYLNGRAASIYGGSSEVQRNLMARAVVRAGGVA